MDGPVRKRPPVPHDPTRRPERTVLLISDNGHGLGHVTRLMAIARRLPPHVRPVLLTLSEAHRTVRDQGFAVEYFPSAPRLGLSKSRWTSMFQPRLFDVLDRVRPQVVVVDHVAPSWAFLAARRAHPDIRFVWSRRGLWRPGANGSAREIRRWFHAVLEPGDLARDHDAGFTATDRADVVEVPPITLLDRHELLDRSTARAELGLPEDGPCALVSLSADDPVDLAALIARVRDVAARVAPDLHLFAPVHPLHTEVLRRTAGVTMHPVYPVARYLRAFDVAITAAGYNVVHEVIRAGVPGVFVPRVTVSVDDQDTRAEAVAARRLGWRVAGTDDASFAEAVRDALRGRRGGALDPDVVTNGAGDAAQWLAALADAPPPPVDPDLPVPPEIEPDYLEGARLRFRSGGAPADAPRAVYDAVDLPDAELAAVADALVARQGGVEPVKPVLLVGAASDTGPLTRHRIAYETVLTRGDLWRVAPDTATTDHRGRRRREVEVLHDEVAQVLVPGTAVATVGGAGTTVGGSGATAHVGTDGGAGPVAPTRRGRGQLDRVLARSRSTRARTRR